LGTVKRAATAFRDEAERMRGRFIPAKTFPLPETGKSRFYIVTDAATLQSALFANEELDFKAHPFSNLARLAQEVITAVREASK